MSKPKKIHYKHPTNGIWCYTDVTNPHTTDNFDRVTCKQCTYFHMLAHFYPKIELEDDQDKILLPRREEEDPEEHPLNKKKPGYEDPSGLDYPTDDEDPMGDGDIPKCWP
jgi:hypothetical protein